MESSEQKEVIESPRKRSLKSDKFFLTSIVVVVLGFILTTIGSPSYHSEPPEPVSYLLNLYNLGVLILLLGVVLVIAALGRYVSKRMSDQDFWWVIKTGPFPKQT